MEFKKTAMGMLAAAVAASPVVVAQGNSAHGSAHGSGGCCHGNVHGTSPTPHGSTGPLFTGIICGAQGDAGDSANLFSEFITIDRNTYWDGGSNGDTTDGNQAVGWRLQTNNIHPSNWHVNMELYSNNDDSGFSGVDTSQFAWFLNNGGQFLGEYLPLDEINNSSPTCITSKSQKNGYTQYTYNANFDPGVNSGTKYGSGIYFMDFGPGDETSWEDLASVPYLAGKGASPDFKNTPSFDCNAEYTDSNVGS